MASKKSVVIVEVYQRETGWDTSQARFENANMHISTSGVLVIRRGDTTRAIRSYSEGLWHTAYVEGEGR